MFPLKRGLRAEEIQCLITNVMSKRVGGIESRSVSSCNSASPTERLASEAARCLGWSDDRRMCGRLLTGGTLSVDTWHNDTRAQESGRSFARAHGLLEWAMKLAKWHRGRRIAPSAWISLASLALLLTLPGQPPAWGASIKFLPTVDLTNPCEPSKQNLVPVDLASGGTSSSSPVYIACASKERRIFYLRYSPKAGITERGRIPGPRLIRAWQNFEPIAPSLGIAASMGYVHVAWIEAPPLELPQRARIVLASRRGDGRWNVRRISASPFEVRLAASGRTAYVVWADPGCEDSPDTDITECDSRTIKVASVTGRKIKRFEISPSVQICAKDAEAGYRPKTIKPPSNEPWIHQPSVTSTPSGPVVAVLDACTSDAYPAIRIWRLAGDHMESLPSPAATPEEYYEPRIYQTPLGLYLIYGFVPIQYKGIDVFLSRYDGNQWSQPEKIPDANGGGTLAATLGRLFVGFGTYDGRQFLAERAETGWVEAAFPHDRRLDGDSLVAQGHNFYFTTSKGIFLKGLKPLLGRAVLR